MQVLKKGREQTGWATETTCTGEGNGGGGCGAELLVDESDLRRYRAEAVFRCCECGVTTDLDVDEAPRAVIARIGMWSSAWRDGTEEYGDWR